MDSDPADISFNPAHRSVDVYSFGVTLLAIAMGSERKLVSQFRTQGSVHIGATGWRPMIEALLRNELPEIIDLIEGCWSQEASDRPRFSEVLARLDSLKPRTAAGLTPSPNTLAQRAVCARALLTDEAIEAAIRRHSDSSKTYVAFLSHHKASCAAEARLVKDRLASTLEADVFLGQCSFGPTSLSSL